MQERARREVRLSELAADIKRAEQRERQRLAGLLHDHVQQLLVAAKMRVDLVASELDDPHRRALTQSLELLNQAIEVTRDLSVQLTPPLLHDQGLPAALGWLTSRLSRQHDRKIDLDVDEGANPSAAEDRDILFQAAHEFLLNAVKHADAKSLSGRLSRSEGWIRLEVNDDGRGFDVSRETAEGSFGLFQIRQRLASIGGYLNIKSMPGEGASAVAVIPAEFKPQEYAAPSEQARRSAGPNSKSIVDPGE